MDDRDPQPTNNSHPNAPQNDDDDMYFGAPQAQGVEFGSSGAANQGPDLSLSFGDDTGSDFATMFPLTHEDQMQGAGETSAPSWSNGPYYHNNPDPTTILNSLVLPGLFPSQPAYGEVYVRSRCWRTNNSFDLDRAPGMPDSIEPRLLRMSSLNHDVLPPLTSTPTFPLSFTKRGVGHFSEQPHNQNPAPSQTLPQDTLYDHRPTISDNNQGPSTSHSVCESLCPKNSYQSSIHPGFWTSDRIEQVTVGMYIAASPQNTVSINVSSPESRQTYSITTRV